MKKRERERNRKKNRKQRTILLQKQNKLWKLVEANGMQENPISESTIKVEDTGDST